MPICTWQVFGIFLFGCWLLPFDPGPNGGMVAIHNFWRFWYQSDRPEDLLPVCSSSPPSVLWTTHIKNKLEVWLCVCELLFIFLCSCLIYWLRISSREELRICIFGKFSEWYSRTLKFDNHLESGAWKKKGFSWLFFIFITQMSETDIIIQVERKKPL